MFGVVLFIFLRSPVSTVSDSRYSLLLTQNLLSRGSFVLDGYGIPTNPVAGDGIARLNGSIYQIEIVDGHFYYYFPPGSSILSAPFVLLADACGPSVVRPDGTYSFAREVRLQRLIASGLMSFLAVVFYVTARLLLPAGWSAFVSLGGSLGTQVWSTASRALWTHTWGIALLGFVVLLLLARETGRRRFHPVWLATALAWAYFVRPTNSLFIVGITAYVLIYERGACLAYAVTGATWFAGFVAFSYLHFGTMLPSYFQAKRLGVAEFWEALVGNLISPSRGVFIYVPITLFVVYLLVRFRRYVPCPRLVWLTVVVSGCHLLAVSSFVPWFGGGCFGPRYTTELVPWFVLLAILGTRAALGWRGAQFGPEPPPEWKMTLGVGGLLLLLSVAINARGACSPAAMLWNEHPVTLDKKPARIWEWRYPQILAGLVSPPLPAQFPPVGAGRISFGEGAGAAFLPIGWSVGEPDYSWSEGVQAALIFSTNHPDASRLRMCFGACVSHDIPRQRVTIRLNGRQITMLTVREAEPREYVFVLPEGTLRPKNFLTFDLPDATAPLTVSDSTDERVLGISLRWLELGSVTAPEPTLP